jgi:hypothetical protein
VCRSNNQHVLAISGQHVAVLAAVIYFSLRTFAVPAATRILTTLALIWLYILVAGAPPSAIRAGVSPRPHRSEATDPGLQYRGVTRPPLFTGAKLKIGAAHARLPHVGDGQHERICVWQFEF